MSSDKRQFADFTQFGGKINADGVYIFPTLYTIDVHENKRFWKVYVRLIKLKSGKELNHKFGWDTKLDKVKPITLEYLDDEDLPDNVICQIWTETGVVNSEKMSRAAPSYPIPANVGKANERNYLKQGLVKARAAYLKQREKGGRTQKEINEGVKKLKEKKENSSKSSSPKLAEITKEARYYPMLARNFKDEKQKLTYPVIVQPKLDGMRCIAFLHPDPESGEKKVVLYSRNMKDIEGFDHVKKELLKPLKKAYNSKKKESLYVDGEFYKHGARLQDIVGEVRNIKKNNKPDEKNPIKLYLFDCFYPSELDTPYRARLGNLDRFFGSDTTIKEKWLVYVPVWDSNDEEEVKTLYKKAIKDKYEGVMIKDPEAPYLTSSTKSGTNLRSYGVLKLKEQFDSEYKIVGFTEGSRGKDKGALIWVLETPDKHQFNATPKNMTYPERYKLFKELSEGDLFNKKYKNKMITVEYQDKSKDGVPLRAKSIGALVRDYE